MEGRSRQPIDVAILGVTAFDEQLLLLLTVDQVAESRSACVGTTLYRDYPDYFSSREESAEIVIIKGGDSRTIPTLLKREYHGHPVVIAYRLGVGTFTRHGNLMRCVVDQDGDLRPLCMAMENALSLISAH